MMIDMNFEMINLDFEMIIDMNFEMINFKMKVFGGNDIEISLEYRN